MGQDVAWMDLEIVEHRLEAPGQYTSREILADERGLRRIGIVEGRGQRAALPVVAQRAAS
jgi:hypothetical protein